MGLTIHILFVQVVRGDSKLSHELQIRERTKVKDRKSEWRRCAWGSASDRRRHGEPAEMSTMLFCSKTSLPVVDLDDL